MKLRLPLLLLTFCGAAHAAYLHNDISLLTYTDFGQNCGRYSTSEVNALLTKLNENGVTISYTGGQTGYTLPQPMIDFSSVVDKGNSTALSYGFVASVRHLQGNDEYTRVQSPTFGLRHVGTEHTIQYQGIEYGNSDRFCLSPEADYKLIRLSKIATDTTPAALFNFTSDSIGQLYSAGAGDCFKANSTGQPSLVHWWSQSIDGSIMMADGLGKVNEDKYWQEDDRGCTDDSIFIQSIVDSWSNDGITTSDPLPSLKYTGDSGSPIFIWDAEEKRYEFIGATNDIIATKGLNKYMAAPVWTAETMASFNKTASLSTTDHQLSLVRTDKSTTVTDLHNRSGSAVYAALADSSGNSLTEFAVLAEGQSTWKSLSDLRNSGNWYNYGASYLNATKNATEGHLDYADLFLTENIILQATDSDTYTVTVKESIDTGIGFLGFTRASDVEVGLFILKGEEGVTLDTAGMVIDSNVIVQCELTHTDADNMREWRKVGNGHLIIAGQGNNEIFLNIGGSGTTILAQQDGYAAHSVIANTGSRVILNDAGQIAGRFTSGTGGSMLDFNGIAEWKEGTHFDINALTQDARFTNSKGSTALYFNRGGTFLGSFTDTADSALKVIYEGSDKWVLNSIHTHLQHADSGLTVKSGHVSLAGNLTEHARGSIAGVDNATTRYTNEDDWHYADATMNVTVQNGGTFELDSHARLTGKVTVQSGGTYIMREGVRHAQEYIEGGYTLENTADIRAFYGHHGDTQLDRGSTLRLAYNEGVTVENVYSGAISGGGTVQVDLDSADSAFRLTGDISQFSGDIILNSGTLLLGATDAIGFSAADTTKAGLVSGINITHGSGIITLSGSEFSILKNTSISLENTATSLVLHRVALEDSSILTTGTSSLVLQESQITLTLNDTGSANGNTLEMQYSQFSHANITGCDLTFLFDGVENPSLYDTLTLSFEATSLNPDNLYYATFFSNPDCTIAGNLISPVMATGGLPQTYTLVFDLRMLPEPATGILSLLSMVALATRRRRK